MKLLNIMGLFTINEGGRWFGLTIQPWCWVRVYLFGRAFNVGQYQPVESTLYACSRITPAMTDAELEMMKAAVRVSLQAQLGLDMGICPCGAKLERKAEKFVHPSIGWLKVGGVWDECPKCKKRYNEEQRVWPDARRNNVGRG